MKKIKSTGIIFGDMHFPLHDEAAFSCALKVIEKVKPSVFINLGILQKAKWYPIGDGVEEGDHL